MAEKLILEFETRTLMGKKVNRLRRQGILPATVYGKNIGPFAVQIGARTFADLLRKSGKTALVEVSIPGQPTASALIHAIQRHPVSRTVIHADLLVVDLKIELTVDVPVTLIGESPLAKLGEAVVNQMLTSVTVRTLPANIPGHLEADISVLDDLDKNVTVSDLKLPEGVSLVNPPDEVVASITATRAEEETATTVETPAEPELVRKERDSDNG
ncbi:MAG: 50S ribosomal protein L25 [Roseiflexaceae bacterium]|nr:50S ribosomal protein L25 [Roseiflexaceae bacterium]